MEGSEGLHERLLHEVFGVGRVAGHAHRRRVELVEERERVALEPQRPLLGSLLNELGLRDGTYLRRSHT